MTEGKEMTFVDHLEELRWHILRAMASVLVFAVVAFLSKKFVFHTLILGPSRTDFWTYRMLCKLGEMVNSDLLCIENLNFSLQSRLMTGQFSMHFSSSIILGIICAFPYAFWEIWRFVKPALHQNEKQVVRGTTFFVSLLFLLGILFGYYGIAPLSINFLAGYQLDPSIQNQFDITSYIGILSMIVLASGVMFQLPIVVYFLSRLGILTPDIMRKFRRHSILGIVILAAIITPPDVFSQILVSVPLIFLYELSIFISAYITNKRKLRNE